MQNEDIYHEKYLKYKTKYQDIKQQFNMDSEFDINQSGGKSGVESQEAGAMNDRLKLIVYGPENIDNPFNGKIKLYADLVKFAKSFNDRLPADNIMDLIVTFVLHCLEFTPVIKAKVFKEYKDPNYNLNDFNSQYGNNSLKSNVQSDNNKQNPIANFIYGKRGGFTSSVVYFSTLKIKNSAGKSYSIFVSKMHGHYTVTTNKRGISAVDSASSQLKFVVLIININGNNYPFIILRYLDRALTNYPVIIDNTKVGDKELVDFINAQINDSSQQITEINNDNKSSFTLRRNDILNNIPWENPNEQDKVNCEKKKYDFNSKSKEFVKPHLSPNFSINDVYTIMQNSAIFLNKFAVTEVSVSPFECKPYKINIYYIYDHTGNKVNTLEVNMTQPT